MMKLLGALMILLACGGAGFAVVTAHRNQERALQQLIRALDYMQSELQFRMPPLPELCGNASQVCTGCVRNVLESLCLELEAQIIPNAPACIYAAVKKQPHLPEKLCKCMMQLGDSLGRFDLAGQIQGLASVRKYTEYELEQLRRNQDVRLRSYQTLGLCAGAALVVLFL